MISGNSIIRDNKIHKTLDKYQLLALNIKRSLKIGLKLNEIEIVKIIEKSQEIVLRIWKLNKFGVKPQEDRKFKGDGGGGGAKVAQNNYKSSPNAAAGVQQEEKDILVLATVIKVIAFVLIAIGVILLTAKYLNHPIKNSQHPPHQQTIFRGDILNPFILQGSQINFIIMQLFQIKFGSPLIVWRVKPEPGD